MYFTHIWATELIMSNYMKKKRITDENRMRNEMEWGNV